MEFVVFCERLETLKLAAEQQALAILWFHDEKEPDVRITAGNLARQIHDSGLGSPNSTRLAERLRATGLVLSQSGGFSLKALARGKIREQLKPILGAVSPAVDQDLGYLPKHVWTKTRGYIERVCEQLNGTFQSGFYDGAAVLVRRLIETLIIEAFETLRREGEIKDASGHYLMLNGLISAVNRSPIGLGREGGKALAEVKELGDRSAHNRRFNAGRADLEKIASGVRLVVDELVNIARLRGT